MRSLIGSFIVLFGVFAAGCAAESTSSDVGDEGNVQETTGTLFRADDVAAPFAEEVPGIPVARSLAAEANEDHGIPTTPSKLTAAGEKHSMGGNSSHLELNP